MADFLRGWFFILILCLFLFLCSWVLNFGDLYNIYIWKILEEKFNGRWNVMNLCDVVLFESYLYPFFQSVDI